VRRQAQRVGQRAREVDHVDQVTARGGRRAHAGARQAGPHQADVRLLAAVPAGGAVAVIGQDQPAAARAVGGGVGGDQVAEHVVGRARRRLELARVPPVRVRGVVGAEHVHEHEARGRADLGLRGEGERTGRPLRHAGRVEVERRPRAGEAERLRDERVRLGHHRARRLARRQGAVGRRIDPLLHELDARLLLGQAGPQDRLHRQGHGREADVDHQLEAELAHLVVVGEAVGGDAVDPVEQDDSHQLGRRQPRAARAGRAGGRRRERRRGRGAGAALEEGGDERPAHLVQDAGGGEERRGERHATERAARWWREGHAWGECRRFWARPEPPGEQETGGQATGDR